MSKQMRILTRISNNLRQSDPVLPFFPFLSVLRKQRLNFDARPSFFTGIDTLGANKMQVREPREGAVGVVMMTQFCSKRVCDFGVGDSGEIREKKDAQITFSVAFRWFGKVYRNFFSHATVIARARS